MRACVSGRPPALSEDMATSAARFAGGAALAGLVLARLLAGLSHDAPAQRSAMAAARAPMSALAFEPNAGRGPRAFDFYARLPRATVAVSSRGAHLALPGR